jgi:hypothetical protein
LERKRWRHGLSDEGDNGEGEGKERVVGLTRLT